VKSDGSNPVFPNLVGAGTARRFILGQIAFPDIYKARDRIRQLAAAKPYCRSRILYIRR
jgi:hypothetical protein